jgi:hypothetical protein
MWRLYVIPIITSGGADPSREPKYVSALGLSWAMMDYGSIPTALVAADVTPTQHAALTANADVDSLPENLDTTLGAASTTVRSRLESYRIPTQWVSGSTTYRALVRFVAGLFQFAQRHQGLHAEDVIGAGLLDSRWRDLSTAQQQRIQTTAASFDYTLTVTNNTPMRDVLSQLANQWSGAFTLGGLTF